MNNAAALILIALISLLAPQNGGFSEALWGGVLVYLWSRDKRLPAGFDGPTRFLWVATFTALVVSGISSRSIGASVMMLVRYAEAFLTYGFFAAQRPGISSKQCASWLDRFAFSACALFLVLVVVQFFLSHVPRYSGLTAVNGHHPIASLLVFFIPVIIATHMRKPTRRSLGIMLLMGTILLFSASRGAILVIIIWLLGTLMLQKATQRQTLLTLIAVCSGISVLTGIFWLSLLPYAQKLAIGDHIPYLRMFIKEDPAMDPRKEFVTQAIAGIRAAPVIGNGPGTFPFVSRAFQLRPAAYSTHAHSLPLQTLSEEGLLGGLPVILLYITVAVSCVRLLRHSGDAMEKALSWSILLPLFYSVFEGNLSGPTEWILWWSLAGFLTGKPPTPRSRTLRGVTRMALMGTLLFVVSFSLSGLLMRFGAPTGTLLIAPYRASVVQAVLAGNQAYQTAPYHGLIRFFHHGDPDIRMLLAARSADPLPDYRAALRADPYAYSFWQRILTHYWEQKDTERLGQLVCDLVKHIPGQDCPIPAGTSQEYLAGTGFGNAIGHLEGTDGLAKFFYFLGLTLYADSANADDAIRFWTLARDAAPDWGYYHLELAGAYYYWKSDPGAARRILEGCFRQIHAKNGCLTTTVEHLYEPGIYASDIANIPAIQ